MSRTCTPSGATLGSQAVRRRHARNTADEHRPKKLYTKDDSLVTLEELCSFARLPVLGQTTIFDLYLLPNTQLIIFFFSTGLKLATSGPLSVVSNITDYDSVLTPVIVLDGS